MMAVACEIAIEAAKKDGIGIVFEETPMGWNAYHRFGDTLPVASLERAIELGTIFFGGVGDFENDSTIGKEKTGNETRGKSASYIEKAYGTAPELQADDLLQSIGASRQCKTGNDSG